MLRLFALFLSFAILLPAADVRSTALQLPLGAPVRVRTATETIYHARLHTVTDEGISVLVLKNGALTEQAYRYTELRHIEQYGKHMSAGKVILITAGVYVLVGITMMVALVAASR